MTWVPVALSGLTYSDYVDSSATSDGSTMTVVSQPHPPSEFGYWAFSPDSAASNVALGWTGRVRLTISSFEATSPGVDEFFQAAYLVQSNSGDVPVLIVENESPPYPASVWGADPVSSFSPNELIGDALAQWYFDPEFGYSGPNQHFSVIAYFANLISLSLLCEVEMNDIGGDCFWTDLVNVVQEC